MIQVEDHVGEKQLDLRRTFKQQDYRAYFVWPDRYHPRFGAHAVRVVGEEQNAAEIVLSLKERRSLS